MDHTLEHWAWNECFVEIQEQVCTGACAHLCAHEHMCMSSRLLTLCPALLSAFWVLCHLILTTLGGRRVSASPSYQRGKSLSQGGRVSDWWAGNQSHVPCPLELVLSFLRLRGWRGEAQIVLGKAVAKQPTDDGEPWGDWLWDLGAWGETGVQGWSIMLGCSDFPASTRSPWRCCLTWPRVCLKT